MENESPAIETESPALVNLPELTPSQREQLELRSTEFVGRWNQLVSTTNWDKGKIIQQWRDSISSSELPEESYTDERWSQVVGGVTPQHVGRLRRTHVRFGHVYSKYEGLFWSHFYAALDWDDAEMWLEGAVQNGWSVSIMRRERWETLGKDPKDKPQVTDIVVTESDEEMQALVSAGRAAADDREYIEGPIHEGPDFGDESPAGSRQKPDVSVDSVAAAEDTISSGPKVKPFEAFTDLPDDLSDALNQLKIAIITHKAKEWDEISLNEMLGVLEALKQLAKAAPE